MLELKLSLLGGMEIVDGTIGGQPLTRKARALLAYLALHPNQSHSREKLAGIFWGSVPDAQARTNLRQALSTLRRTLAAANGTPILAESDLIAINPNGLQLDVRNFEALIDKATTESLEKALVLYKGDLFDGFSLKEPAFEEWAAIERARLRMRAIEALETLVVRYRDTKNYAMCLQHAVRLLAVDPLREDMHREVMRIHAAQGHINAAMKQYEVCCEILRRELGIQPEVRTRELCREIRNRRERPGDRTGALHDHETTALTDSKTTPDDNPLPNDAWSAVQLDLSVPGKPSVAVLPFANEGGDPEKAYFANGLTENIIAGLTRFRDLFVIGFPSSSLAQLASQDAQELGQRLGVANLVIGSVRRSGDRVRATVQLVDTQSGQRLWVERVDRDFDDMFEVQDEITDIIVATLAGRIEQASRHRSVRKPAGTLSAYDYVLRARECMRQGSKPDELAARSYLDRAIAEDPEYAAAYAAYAYSYIHEYEAPWSPDRDDARKRAFELARKAVSLDETDSIARRVLAYAAHYCGEVELACKEIETALALNPNDYSNTCVKAWILNFGGRPEKGLACRDRSLRINPFTPDNCLFDAGIALYMLKNYDKSVESFARMGSWDLLRLPCLAAGHAQFGNTKEAATVADAARAAIRATYGDVCSEARDRWQNYAWSVLKFRRESDRAHLMAGFRKAGLME
jgi:TolB-like protein/DNA-binding SARP family transcriptional activator